jgi:hypothetical protein
MNCCKFEGCKKPLVMKPDERPNNFKRRVFCGLSCMARYRNGLRRGVRTPTKPRPCDNKACSNMMHRAETEGIKRFLARQYCSRACGSAAMRRPVREPKKASGWHRIARDYFARPAEPKNTGITNVAEFMAKHGVTKCPPAYAFHSTGQISDEARQFHAERYAEIERQKQANTKRRGVSA